jgi:PleD family two-component response regulator
LNQGSEFIVRLPLGRATAQETEPAHLIEPPDSNVKMKILVVDDNRDVATSCAELLRLDGHDVRIAFDARRAIEVAATFRPHVFLLDIGLPDMSGLHLTVMCDPTRSDDPAGMDCSELER